jgi:hypothetical protein
MTDPSTVAPELGVRGHLKEAGSKLGDHIKNGYNVANQAIKDHGIGGAIKAAYKANPLATLGTGAVLTAGAAYVACTAVKGRHAREQDRRRAMAAQLERY